MARGRQMSDHKPSDENELAGGKKAWFGQNQSGFGFHPQTWQGWLILLGAVAVIACVVILLRIG